jgi:hypothetical protein
MVTPVPRSAAYASSEISGVWSDMRFLSAVRVLGLLRNTLGGMYDECKTPPGVFHPPRGIDGSRR